MWDCVPCPAHPSGAGTQETSAQLGIIFLQLYFQRSCAERGSGAACTWGSAGVFMGGSEQFLTLQLLPHRDRRAVRAHHPGQSPAMPLPGSIVGSCVRPQAPAQDQSGPRADTDEYKSHCKGASSSDFAQSPLPGGRKRAPKSAPPKHLQ